MATAQMTHYMWALSLLKRGTTVMVNINYTNAPGIPERWAVGTLVGHGQGGRLSRIMFDDVRHRDGSPVHDFAGTTTLVASFRVRPARLEK